MRISFPVLIHAFAILCLSFGIGNATSLHLVDKVDSDSLPAMDLNAYRWNPYQISQIQFDAEAAYWPWLIGAQPDFHSAIKPYIFSITPNGPSNQTAMGRDKASSKYGQWSLPYLKQRSLWYYRSGEPSKPSEPSTANSSSTKYLQMEPLWDLGLGMDRSMNNPKQGGMTYQNGRGIQLTGQWTSSFRFVSSIWLVNNRVPDFVNQQAQDLAQGLNIPDVGVVPGLGLARPTGPSRTWDLYLAEALLRWEPRPWLNIHWGHSKNFIGHGYRSLLISDASPAFTHLRIQARWGPLQYQYYAGQMLDYGSPQIPNFGPNRDLSLRHGQKFTAMSYLDWNLNRKLQVGLFQAIVWPSRDSLGYSGWSWAFAQPLLFLIPAQFHTGSYGNSLIGANIGYRMGSKSQLYSQLAVDEMYMREFLRLSNYWANKYAFQIGAKGWNPWGLQGFRWLSEINIVRPFMYSHWSTATNYGHQQSALAHPLGANFRELMAHAHYFRGPWQFSARNSMAVQGKGSRDTLNRGDLINQNYYQGLLPGSPYPIGSGTSVRLVQSEWQVAYMLYSPTRLMVNLTVLYRRRWTREGWTAEPYGQQSLWINLGLRTALQNLYKDF